VDKPKAHEPLRRYRVEWRARVSHIWTRMGERDAWDEALELAEALRAQYGGATRIVGQQVMLVTT
jgi:hypothetical protein